MRSLIAIVTGSLFIIIIGLLVQLAYVFLALASTLAGDWYWQRGEK